MIIQLAGTDEQILNCFSAMSQLRPHLLRDEFVDRIRQQMNSGYKLAFLETENRVVAVTGFRISECLSWGKFLYVDDLVVDELVRSKSYGEKLFQWLMEYAKQHDCQQLELDSGVQRFDAHRFYFRQRMSISGYHFSRKL
ncbi:GNAT family N-acetyltransferase [[Phormidium ambiguum] IAM M-71]|uniref:GNAT family N-acetyltransferase n=1 Tax=[Phormidium ambiguum] IAM M-71 TaxID=454136 RepID=A0A1U7IQ11_9CYAN|nr:GNAT family N-acetyltransferase [Phormidium ambiguum]OKH39438.1 GNAT family N-acetyltransferase [Phormidium ambiguum IAM M-71]